MGCALLREELGVRICENVFVVRIQARRLVNCQFARMSASHIPRSFRDCTVVNLGRSGLERLHWLEFGGGLVDLDGLRRLVVFRASAELSRLVLFRASANLSDLRRVKDVHSVGLDGSL